MGKTKSSKKKGEFIWSGDASRIIPLKNNYCYIFDEKGKTHHLERDSEEATSLLQRLNEVMDGKIFADLTKLGWAEQLEKL